MDPIWSPSTLEIKTLTQPNIYTLWLYKKAYEREHKTPESQDLLNKKTLQKQIDNKLILEKIDLNKKIDIRINNDGSICKFLC